MKRLENTPTHYGDVFHGSKNGAGARQMQLSEYKRLERGKGILV